MKFTFRRRLALVGFFINCLGRGRGLVKRAAENRAKAVALISSPRKRRGLITDPAISPGKPFNAAETWLAPSWDFPLPSVRREKKEQRKGEKERKDSPRVRARKAKSHDRERTAGLNYAP